MTARVSFQKRRCRGMDMLVMESVISLAGASIAGVLPLRWL